jgi:hypothetical protein
MALELVFLLLSLSATLIAFVVFDELRDRREIRRRLDGICTQLGPLSHSEPKRARMVKDHRESFGLTQKVDQ